MSSRVQTGALGWIMIGSPTASAASRARCSAGSALFPARFSLIRALTPTITSRWRSQTSMALLGVDEPDVLELAHNRRDHARRGDVETGLEARFGDLDHVASQALEGVGAGRPGVDGRGDAAGQDVGVGVDAVVADAVVDVHVDVDEAGRDQQARSIEDVVGLSGSMRSATACTRPPAMATSRWSLRPCAGSTTAPPEIRRSYIARFSPLTGPPW